MIPWPLIAAGALVGALAAGGVQQWRVANVQGELDDTRAGLAAMTVQRDGALGAAEECSERVAEMQILAAERARAADDARRRADALAAKHGERADVILSTPLAFPDDPCASANELLRQWLEQ